MVCGEIPHPRLQRPSFNPGPNMGNVCDWEAERNHVLDTTLETHAGWEGGLCRAEDGPVCDNVDPQTHYTPQVKRGTWQPHMYLHSASANNGASSEKDCSLRGNGVSKSGKREMQKDKNVPKIFLKRDLISIAEQAERET